MKILYILPGIQHPTLRGPTRHYQFLRSLSQRHRITLLALTRIEPSPAVTGELSKYAQRVLTFDTTGAGRSGSRSVLGRIPLIGRRIEQEVNLQRAVGRLKAAVRDLLQNERFHVILFHGKFAVSALEDVKDVPIVVDFCDATSMRVKMRMPHVSKFKVPLLGLRYLQVRHIENRLLKTTPHVAFISCRDREAILGADDHSVVLPNGMDLDYWTRRTPPPQSNSIIFTGVMDYAPNHDAAMYLIDRVLPRLRQSVPDLEVIIAGRDPLPELIERGRRHPQVTVTGFVDDMRTYLERAAVFVAPVRFASGMQNKAQEALAMEVPVVATSIVADGLVVSGKEPAPLHVADGDSQFADRIASLLADDSERRRLAAEGRKFVEKHYNWSNVAETLEDMCLRAIADRSTLEQRHDAA